MLKFKKIGVFIALLLTVFSVSALATAAKHNSKHHRHTAKQVSNALPATLDTSTTPPPVPNNDYYLDRPWAVMVYHGILAQTTLLKALTFDYGSSNDNETITTLDVAKELAPDNLLRHYLQPFVSTVDIATTFGYLTDPQGPIYEIDPYIMVHWDHLPWERYVANTFGIGWGVSYDTRVTTWESQDSNSSKRFLNYLAFETTFALPRYPQLQLVFRIHHRSGAFGLYGADNTGTNIVGAGLRYYF